MEYCDGGDLSKFIKKRKQLPESICQRFLQQLALALKYLRDHNVCHMDLKPENLLLVRRPYLKLKLGGSFKIHIHTHTHIFVNLYFKLPGKFVPIFLIHLSVY